MANSRYTGYGYPDTLIKSTMAPQRPADLILGTAQFGLDYGITNVAGRPRDGVLDAILRRARRDIGWLDTSIKYGDALNRLGRENAAAPFAIVTKIEAHNPETVADEIALSLTRLRRTQLDVVLFHNPVIFEDRARASDLAAALRAEVAAGRVKRIGASLYDSIEVDRALAAFTPDILQLPANIADTRLTATGTAMALERSGIAVHYRSAFLQGLLLTPLDRLPAKFIALQGLLVRLDRLANELGATRQQLCINWILGLPAATGIVCGVTTEEELGVLVEAYRTAKEIDIRRRLEEIVGETVLDARLLDPRQWPSL